MMKYYKTLLLWGLMLFNGISWATTYPEPPNPFRYVSDYTHTLNETDKQTLENALVEYGKKTSSQIAVVILPTIGNEDIAIYSTNLYNKWGIGREKINNGVLLFIAKNDRKLYITTGYGLEGALPDAIASSIIRNEITPYFRQERYAEGIAKGLSAIIAATQGEYAALVEDENEAVNVDDFILFLFFAIAIFFIFLGHTRGGSRYVSPSQADRLLRTASTIARNGGFNAGFGRGRSGGFGGGGFGGGRSGGGGAGGSW